MTILEDNWKVVDKPLRQIVEEFITQTDNVSFKLFRIGNIHIVFSRLLDRRGQVYIHEYPNHILAKKQRWIF